MYGDYDYELNADMVYLRVYSFRLYTGMFTNGGMVCLLYYRMYCSWCCTGWGWMGSCITGYLWIWFELSWLERGSMGWDGRGDICEYLVRYVWTWDWDLEKRQRGYSMDVWRYGERGVHVAEWRRGGGLWWIWHHRSWAALCSSSHVLYCIMYHCSIVM